MRIHSIDIVIISLYLILMVLIGLFLKKRAGRDMDSYFLGGKSLPFYMLGLSNASGMFDITGTMLMVYWAFAYGFKSLWIPWLWAQPTNPVGRAYGRQPKTVAKRYIIAPKVSTFAL